MTDVSGPPTIPGVLWGGLWIDGATAGLLCEALRVAFREARRDGVRPDPRLLALAKGADEVARHWTASAEYLRNTGTPHRETSVNLAYVGTTEAARLLKGISCRAVRGLAERGTLPGYKHGKDWRFALADVVQLAEDREERMHA